MNKQTKRIRRNRKNRTRKYYGGSTEVTDKMEVTDKTNVTDKSKGIFDVISDKITGYSGKAINYVKDKGLRLVGLQPIQQPEVEQR